MTLATLILADLNLSLSNVLWWLVVGSIAGFLASRVMRGGGYGLIGDIVVGLIGAFIGGVLAGLLGLGSFGLIGTIVVAFLGACILLAILHAVTRGGASRSRGVTTRLFRYRNPSLKTMLGVTKAKKRFNNAVGITAVKRPFRAPGNFKRRMLRRLGYYSEPMKMFRFLRRKNQGNTP
jgi:uncharacterized membrane protein YeaQ/YmgE (transglycosylase-associated protein family)